MSRTRSIPFAVLALLMSTFGFALQPNPTDPTDLTPRFRSVAVPISNLQVFELGGIVVIRGRTAHRASAEEAGRIAQALGYTRVANLVQVVEPPDDAAIQREAERQLSQDGSLEGCKLLVGSQGGVLHVKGTVSEEIQKDEVIALMRTIDGVREVRTDLQTR